MLPTALLAAVAILADGSVAIAATAPSQPSAPTPTPGDSSVSLTWTAPADNGSPITEYTVTSAPDGQTCTTAATACTVSGLRNEENYRFTVVATSAVGSSPTSALSVAVRPTHVPVVVASSSTSIGGGTLAFTHPTESAVFVVETAGSRVHKFDTTSSTIATTANLGLGVITSGFMDTSGAHLYFTLQNSSTIVKFSTSAMAVVATANIAARSPQPLIWSQLDPTGAFGLFDEDGFDGAWHRVRLSDMTWVSTLSGFSRIIGAFAYSNDGSAAYGVLRDGGSFSCCTWDMVSKSYSTGTTANKSDFVMTTGTVFSAPTAAHLSSALNRIFVVNRSGITRYTPNSASSTIIPFTYYLGSAFQSQFGPQQLSLMSNDGRYIYVAPVGQKVLSKIRLSDLTLVGNTTLSARANFATGAIAMEPAGNTLRAYSSGLEGEVVQVSLADVSSAPTNLQITSRRLTEFSVVWDPPSTKASLVTDYQVEYSADGATWLDVPYSGVTSARSATISPISPDADYRVRITALSGSAKSASASLTGIRSGVAPSVSEPSLSSGRTTVTASWSILDPGDSSVTGFGVELSTDGTNWGAPVTVTDTTYTFTDLLPDSEYYVRVSGVSDVGPGPASAAASLSTLALSAPTSLTVTERGINSVSIAWVAPEFEPELVDDYAIEYSTDGSAWTVFEDGVSTSTSATVTGLVKGTSYWVRVSAVDRTVTSSPISLSGVASAVEPTVTVPSLTATRSSVTASWNVSDAGGMTVTAYTVQLSMDGTTWGAPVTVTDTTYTFTKLRTQKTYYVRVQAINGVGAGSWSVSSGILLSAKRKT
jgi:large repetitive protein